MVYSVVALVVGIHLVTLTLLYYSSLATYGMVLVLYSVMYSQVLVRK